MMLKVAVGTKSALKLRAVQTALESMLANPFEVIPHKAESGVCIQPVGVEEYGTWCRKQS